MTDISVDYEPIGLLGCMFALAERERERFSYDGCKQENGYAAHTFNIKVDAFDEALPISIYADQEGGEVLNLHEVALLNTLLELACQDHGWELEMIMNGAYSPADYSFVIYDLHEKLLGSGGDSSREIALIQAYLEALHGHQAQRAMDA